MAKWQHCAWVEWKKKKEKEREGRDVAVGGGKKGRWGGGARAFLSFPIFCSCEDQSQGRVKIPFLQPTRRLSRLKARLVGGKPSLRNTRASLQGWTWWRGRPPFFFLYPSFHNIPTSGVCRMEFRRTGLKNMRNPRVFFLTNNGFLGFLPTHSPPSTPFWQMPTSSGARRLTKSRTITDGLKINSNHL